MIKPWTERVNISTVTGLEAYVAMANEQEELRQQHDEDVSLLRECRAFLGELDSDPISGALWSKVNARLEKE